jgi:hypothetical protein
MLGKYLACCFSAAAATCLLTSSSLAYTGQEFGSRAKITIDASRNRVEGSSWNHHR